MTLVSAPAGFGKTTCVCEWVSRLGRRPVAWLSLDAADDDPARFFAYLLAALRRVDARVGREIAGVIGSGQAPPAEAIATTLCNDLHQVEAPFVLVLDDVQVLQDALILHVLERLAGNMPPALHLVLVTREDPPLPLARLRANNQLTEMRAADLRLTQSDTAHFLNEIMALSLSETDITMLEERTEGWIVGLQLAALSVQGRPDPSRFVSTLSGSHRFILGYLTEEVLGQQPADIQKFLLQTSILDRLNGDLCDAVTGRPDSHALLERLYHANLFLTPLDDERKWYRYHHLFADLLRDLLAAAPERDASELHRRASAWCDRAGMPREAIDHALAAMDYATAISLIEAHAMDMIMQGHAKTVHGWVGALPAEWRTHSPRTDLAFAWMHMLRGDYAQANECLERLEAWLADSPEPASESQVIEAEWLAIRTLMSNMRGDAAAGHAQASRALELAPPAARRVRSLAYFGLAGVYQLMDDYPRAVEAYQMAIRLGRQTENSVAEMMSIAGLAQMAFEHGQLHLAWEIASPASARIEHSGSPPPISAVIFGLLGQVLGQWHRLDEALDHVLRALQLSILGGYHSGIVFYRGLLAQWLLAAGDAEASEREILLAVDSMHDSLPTDIREETVARQVRIALARQRPASAEMALQGYGFSYRDEFVFPTYLPRTGHRILDGEALQQQSARTVASGRAPAGASAGRDRTGRKGLWRRIARPVYARRHRGASATRPDARIGRPE